MLTQIKFGLQKHRLGASFRTPWHGSARGCALLALGALFLGGCGGSDDRTPFNTSSRANALSTLPRVTVHVRDPFSDATAYDCWVASTPSQRNEGLSYISPEEFTPGRAMVAVYPGNSLLAFAGSRTTIGVEVIYAEDAGEGVGRITDIGVIYPRSGQPFGSSKPVKYALFIQGGDIARSGAKVGDLIYVPFATPSR